MKKRFKEFLPAMEACKKKANQYCLFHSIRQRYSDRSYIITEGMGNPDGERSSLVFTARPKTRGR